MQRQEGAFFSNDACPQEISPKTVRIYRAGRVPRPNKFKDYEEMEMFVPNAYPINIIYNNDLKKTREDGTRAFAVWVVACCYRIIPGEVIRCFDICVIPGPSPRGRIFVRRKNDTH